MEVNFKDSNEFSNKLAILSTDKKDRGVISKYHDEFKELDRKQRDTQIGKTQIDKIVKIRDGEKVIGNKIVKANRVPIAFANKIVNTSVAFEFGEPVTLTPEEETPLSDQVLLDWKNARLDYKIQVAKRKQKEETQSALLFYFKDLKTGVFNKVLGSNKKRAISTRVLDYDSGEFFPYFDMTGDMKYFIYIFQNIEYSEELKREETVEHCWIYQETSIVKMKRNGAEWIYESEEKHGFSKIPVVYMSQPVPEHYYVKEAIDRIETCISKLGASNDYSGHPILFIEGEIYGLPDKNADGKVMKTKLKYNEEGKKTSGGDAKFLTHDNAPESVKLEIEKLEDYIYTMTSTPNISFSNLKSIGNVSGKALELMFLDSTLKKMMNEGQNRTDIERCINIIISGIVTTSQTALSTYTDKTIFNIEFGNVLPNNFDELVSTVAIAVQGGFMSKEEAIELVGVADDLELELERINNGTTSPEVEPVEE